MDRDRAGAGASSSVADGAQVAYEVDRDGRLTWRGSVAALLGAAPAPATLAGWLDLVHPDDRARAADALAARGAAANRVCYRVVGLDGDVVEVIDAGAPAPGEARVAVLLELSGLLAAGRDAERARGRLHDTERRAALGHFELELATGELRASDGVYRLLGDDPRGPTLTFAGLGRRLTEGSWQALREALAACAAGTVGELELAVSLAAARGGARELELRGERVARGPGGAVVVGTVRDVTALRRTAEALRRLETTHQRVVAALPLVVWSVGLDRRVTAVMGGRLRELGIEAATLVGLRVEDIPGSSPDVGERVTRALAGIELEETTSFRDRIARVHWFPEYAPDGTVCGATGFALDLTAHVQAERARQAADEHLRLIAKNVTTVVWVASPALDHIYYLSPSFERVFGRPVAALQAEPARWGELIHPDDRGRVLAAAAACPWMQDQRHRIVWPDGTVRWVAVTVRPVHDERGEVSRAVGTAEDVTSMQAALDELQRTTAELKRSLDEKSTLLREVHHRVRNNLQVIQSLLTLQLRAVADPAMRRVLGDSQRRVQAMALVQDHLYDGRDLRRVALGAYLRRLLQALAVAHGDGAGRVTLRLDVCEAVTDVDTAVHVGIAVAELVSNAFEHAFPDERGGAISVRTVVRDHRLVIDVEDDGVGLPPGFTLEGASSLGLTLVQTTVLNADGALRIEPCGGACFRIEVPLRRG